jgi:D-alanyl-D-alanine dipeptidase
MSLISIQSPDIIIDLAYATPDNFIGKVVYHNPQAFLHIKALEKLEVAAQLAKNIGYRLKILDAFRPTEAQWVLWEVCPNPRFVADPRKGSCHSRGIAVDLTLADRDGNELDMGTPFDHLTSQSYHGDNTISQEAQKNRFILLGIMARSGWDHYNYEWWHYQLFHPQEYPLLSDKDAPQSLMSPK